MVDTYDIISTQRLMDPPKKGEERACKLHVCVGRNNCGISLAAHTTSSCL